MVESIKMQLSSKLNEKNAVLKNHTQSIEIEADEEKLTQVLLNLIDNSIDSIGMNGHIIIETNIYETDSGLIHRQRWKQIG